MVGNLHTSSSLPVIIALMYHRIDVTDTDPWGICVSPENFEQQIQFLKSNLNVISIDNLIKQVTTGNIINNSVCITFDDGYADNYINAKSILEKYNCPATFFIATGYINQTKPFWWDELEMIFLHSKKLPPHVSLEIDGNSYKYVLNENELSDEQWQQHKQWKWFEAAPTDRCKAFINIWEKLKPLHYNEILIQLNKIKESCGYNENGEHRLPMNDQQLLKLSNNKLFSIGLHTHTHPDLQSKEKHIQAEEIVSCKKVLRNKLGIESNCFAYPFGNYNNDTIEVSKSLNLSACFTTEAININAESDVAKLGRYQVLNSDITSFKSQLNNRISKTDLFSYDCLIKRAFNESTGT